MDGDSSGFTITAAPPAAFWTDDCFDWSEASIPRREWLAPGHFLRGSLSVLVGAPGASKSTLALAWAIALALGEPFGRLRPATRQRILFLNCEDDLAEQRRRTCALVPQFGRVPRDLAGHLMLCGPERVAPLVEKDPTTGTMRRSDGFAALEAIVAAFKPDLMILDPMIEMFAGLDENDNGAVSAALSELRALAHERRMAILLIHHIRKGALVAGDMDAARGASALIGKVRQGFTLTSMSEQEAAQLGIHADARRHYLRLDAGKASYAELSAAEWFERTSTYLENGDTAPRLAPWQPPADVITPEVRAAVDAGIAAGTPEGPWSPRLSTKPRSVRHLFIDAGITTTTGQTAMLADLRARGFDVEAGFRDRNRKPAAGIRTPDGRPTTADWQDRSAID